MRRIVNPYYKRASGPMPDTVDKITVDLDGVIVKIVPRVLELFRQDGGLPTEFAKITEYNMQKFLRYANGSNITAQHLIELFKMAWSEPEKLEVHHRNTKAIMDGPIGGWRLNILTSSWGDQHNVLKFLERNGIFFDELIMVGTEKEKVQHAGEIHLDDNSETAIAIANSGKYTFILKSPYSGPFNKVNKFIFEVRDWPHFCRMVTSGVYLNGAEDLSGYENIYIE